MPPDSMVSLADLEPFFRVGLMGFALILTFLMGVATYRVRSVKLLLVTFGFAAFSIKGLLLTLGMFFANLSRAFPANPEILIIDFAILVLLYAGMVKGP